MIRFFLIWSMMICSVKAQLYVADPFILKVDQTYYLYGTDDKNAKGGFPVYTSTDMIHWSGPAGNGANGLALAKGESFGTKGFWAPMVVNYKGIYYMYYTADEKIAVATSESPLGPFKQSNFQPVIGGNTKEIDPHVFIDENGQKFIYFARLINGNRTYGAELNDDMQTIKETSIVECISYSQPWEVTSGKEWPVTEAPAMIKNQQKYYLFYTGNDFRSPAYNVGYAVSDSPLGPFKKYEHNPIIKQDQVVQGTGGCEFVTNSDNELIMVYHAHNGPGKPTPRKTVISKTMFFSEQGSDNIIFKVSDKKTFLKLQKLP
ncbi:MAG: beta-xylosidase [Chitinophagaceae bacterium]|nr:MAG: beta-xylosidase [Chitinophagaceae bacterium]